MNTDIAMVMLYERTHKIAGAVLHVTTKRALQTRRAC